MRIEVIAIGKTKDSWIKEGMEEYMKRIAPYALFSYEELKESKASEAKECMREDGERLVQKQKEGAIHILLDPAGSTYDSLSFAETILKASKERGTPLQFFIAGAFGMEDAHKKLFAQQLSLSPLTFTHQMTRVILLEQLYRGATILAGKQYHY